LFFPNFSFPFFFIFFTNLSFYLFLFPFLFPCPLLFSFFLLSTKSMGRSLLLLTHLSISLVPKHSSQRASGGTTPGEVAGSSLKKRKPPLTRLMQPTPLLPLPASPAPSSPSSCCSPGRCGGRARWRAEGRARRRHGGLGGGQQRLQNFPPLHAEATITGVPYDFDPLGQADLCSIFDALLLRSVPRCMQFFALVL
jgi:hypothetical protein